MSDVSVTSARLQQQFGTAILAQHTTHGDDTLVVSRDAWRAVMRFLRDDPDLRYNFLMDLTAVDYLTLGRTPRYEVVAHLYSLPHNQRVRLKAPVPEDDPRIDSLMPVWEGANWFEREAYDMFGLTLPITRTCDVSCSTRALKGIRCARITHRRKSSRSIITPLIPRSTSINSVRMALRRGTCCCTWDHRIRPCMASST